MAIELSFGRGPNVEGVRALANAVKRANANSLEPSSLWTFVGDSINDGTDEAAYYVGQRFAAFAPNVCVPYYAWSDSRQDYDAPVYISQGASGPRHIVVTSTARSLDPADVGEITTDLDVRLDFAPTDWTPSSTSTVIARWGGSTAKSWRLQLKTDSALIMIYRVDEVAADITATSSATLASVVTGLTDGMRLHVRATIDVDNGASGKTVRFYWKLHTDSVWTELGTGQVSATAATRLTTTAVASQTYSLGGAIGATCPGLYYGAEIRNGIGGPDICPQPIDRYWRDSINAPVGGSPTLSIYNGCKSGANWAYINHARFSLLVPKSYDPLITLCHGHNNYTDSLTTFLASATTFFDAVPGRMPLAQVSIMMQNPRLPAQAQPEHAMIENLLVNAAIKRGGGFFDTRLPFLTSSAGLATLINVDGVHPDGPGGGKTLMNEAFEDELLGYMA